MTETEGTALPVPGNSIFTRRLARLVTHLLSPGGVAALVFVGIPYLEEEGGLAGLVAVGLYVAVPLVLMLVMKAAWRIDDVYDPGPRLRGRFLSAGVILYLIGFIILMAMDSTPAMRWAAATFLGGAALVWGITRYWKISIHAVGVGGGTVILMVVGGVGLWPVLVAPVVVTWSRLQLGAHTLGQLVAGIALGGAVAGALLVTGLG